MVGLIALYNSCLQCKLHPLPQATEDESLPQWAKMAKRKTWAVEDTEAEDSRTSVSSAGGSEGVAPPKPSRVTIPKAEQSTGMTSELQSKLGARIDLSSNNSHCTGTDTAEVKGKQGDALSDASDRPMLYSSRVQPIKCEKGPSITNRKSPYDNVTLGYYAERKLSSGDEPKSNDVGSKVKAETSMVFKAKCDNAKAKSTTTGSTNTSSSGETLPAAQLPWKASLKQRTGEYSLPFVATCYRWHQCVALQTLANILRNAKMWFSLYGVVVFSLEKTTHATVLIEV